MLDALTNIKRKFDEQSETEIDEEISYINKVHDRTEKTIFPYEYDPNNQTPNFLQKRK